MVPLDVGVRSDEPDGDISSSNNSVDTSVPGLVDSNSESSSGPTGISNITTSSLSFSYETFQVIDRVNEVLNYFLITDEERLKEKWKAQRGDRVCKFIRLQIAPASMMTPERPIIDYRMEEVRSAIAKLGSPASAFTLGGNFTPTMLTRSVVNDSYPVLNALPYIDSTDTEYVWWGYAEEIALGVAALLLLEPNIRIMLAETMRHQIVHKLVYLFRFYLPSTESQFTLTRCNESLRHASFQLHSKTDLKDFRTCTELHVTNRAYRAARSDRYIIL